LCESIVRVGFTSLCQVEYRVDAWKAPKNVLPPEEAEEDDRDAVVEGGKKKKWGKKKQKGKGGKANDGKKKNPWLGGRPGMVPRLGPMLCQAFAEGTCKYGDACKNNHNVDLFLSQKPPNISDKCHVFETFGRCSDGIKCRFSASHIAPDGKTNVVDEAKYAQHKALREASFPVNEDVLHHVTKGNYPLQIAEKVTKV
jgi:hypothetical protein